MTRPLLHEGMVLESLMIEVDPCRMKTMALLLRDPNPIHWDVEVNERLGLGGRPVNQGPISMSYLIEIAGRAAGGVESLRRFTVRFTGNVFGGDLVECGGTVTAVDELAGTAELELTASVEGRPVMRAEATVTLDS